MRARSILLFSLVFLGLLAALSAGVHTLTRDNNLGTDFFTFWLAGRTAFVERTTPYSQEIATQGQLAIFKRLALPGEDQLAFAYPPYALLPLYPLVLLPFDWAQAIWIAFLLLAWVTAFALAFPRAPRWVGLSFLAFYPVFFGLVLGNFAILITALLVLLLIYQQAQARGSPAWQVAAGILTAWLTVKPQFTWPYLLFLGLLALRKRQWTYLASAALAWLVFLGLSFWIVPGWPAQWLARIVQYSGYNQTWLIALYLLRQVTSGGLAAALTVALGVVCLGVTVWLARDWWRERISWLALLAWLGWVGYLFHPRGVSYEQIVFLLPLGLWACLAFRGARLAVLGWWLGSLTASWTAFVLSVGPNGISSATEWPLLLHAAWVGWFLWRQRAAPLPRLEIA